MTMKTYARTAWLALALAGSQFPGAARADEPSPAAPSVLASSTTPPSPTSEALPPLPEAHDGPSKGAATTAGPTFALHVSTTDPEVRLYLEGVTGESPVPGRPAWRDTLRVDGKAVHFGPVCVAPCTTTLARGTYHVALAEDDRELHLMPSSLVLESNAKIEGRYISRQGTRNVGWMIAGLGTAVTGGLIYASTPTATRESYDGGFAAAAVGTMIATVLLASFFVSAKDEASIVVTPSR